MKKIKTIASKEACECFDFLNEMIGLKIEHVHFNETESCRQFEGKEYDDYIPNIKIRCDGREECNHQHVWEYLGRYWHGFPGSMKYTTTMARLHLLADHGYVVHYIWSDEWFNAKTLKEKIACIHVLSPYVSSNFHVD